MKSIDLKNELNPPQYEAAAHYNGASLIIAGAGSGKTRTLTYRIAYMISQGVLPQNILALTFTNKAASEMRERIKQVVGWQNSRNLWMGTFHSIFSRILRCEPQATGFPATYTIYDTADSRSLLKSIIKELGYDENKYKVGDVLSRISSAKNSLVTPQVYASYPQYSGEDAKVGKPYISNIYTAYVQKCKLANAMDFDDLLLRTNILFRDHPEVLEKYQKIFRYILVDEYQDTNYSQYLIIKKLAAGSGNICVVGDDAQSIYAFRGARIENILNFRKDYPNFSEYKLEQNYRSTQTIVDAANSVIKNNSNQIKKQCFSQGDQGEKIGVISAFTDQEEAYKIVDSIMNNIALNSAAFSDFAVLYRTNAQSRALEDALRRKSIPYKIYGGMSFYQRAEVKNFLSYLRLCINHSDDEAFKRIVNYPVRGIGDTTLDRLQAAAVVSQKSLFDTVLSANLNLVDIKLAAQKKLRDFVDFIQTYTTKIFSLDAFDFAKELAGTSGMIADLQRETTPEGVSKYENLESLLNGIKEFCDNEKAANDDAPDLLITINQYVDNVALITDADDEKEEDRNKISLMTVHQAKGLEYAYVYISGMEENLFPGSIENLSLFDLEEERRLFYVALTRAKTRAYISFAQTRYRWGKLESHNVSRFAREIDDNFLETSVKDIDSKPIENNDSDDFENRFERHEIKRRADANHTTIIKRPTLAQHDVSANFVPSNCDDIRLGMRVEHNKFGFGKVVNIDGSGPEGRMTVMFDDGSKRTLIFKFAKVMIVE